jgi:hypothetical protein
MRSSRATAKTPDGHGTFILTIMDTYLRYPTVVPIKAATAKVARGLFDGWIVLFGIMEVLLSDRGFHFINGVISDLLKLL